MGELNAVLPWFAGIAGLIIGSFLNVCIYRIPRDMSIVTPRSFCPECGRPIPWFDNVPLLSFILLRGHCRNCSRRISWRYPAVELTTAILFGLLAAKFGPSLLALKWMFFECLLIVLFWTDLEERILPDELTLGGIAAGLAWALLTGVPSAFGALLLPNSSARWQSLISALLSAVLCTSVLWLVGFVYKLIRRREVLGLGDVKLLPMLGVFLGVENGVLALLIGSVTGSILGLSYIVWRKKNPSSYELPLGSFLCFGAALVPLVASKFSTPLGVP